MPGRAEDERVIVGGERAWGRAYITGDVGTPKRLLTEDFLGVDPRGRAYNKGDVLQDVRDGPHGTADEVGAVTVRFHGDTAIAQAHEHEVGPAPEYKPAERLAHAQVDTDLDSLRDDARFQVMIAAAEARLAEASPADGAGA